MVESYLVIKIENPFQLGTIYFHIIYNIVLKIWKLNTNLVISSFIKDTLVIKYMTLKYKLKWHAYLSNCLFNGRLKSTHRGFLDRDIYRNPRISGYKQIKNTLQSQN